MGSGKSDTDWNNAAYPGNLRIIYKVGIYGWRKRCLYVFILITMVVIIINFALTVWVLRVMDFSMNGMGPLRINKNGIRVEGDTEFLKALYASHLKSRQNHPLYLHSSKKITLTSRNDEEITNRFIIGDDGVKSYSKQFELHSKEGRLLFSANESQVYIGADRLRLSGPNGAMFPGSLQTPLVKSYPGKSLNIKSAKSIHVHAKEGLNFKAPSGSISIESDLDIKLASNNNAIHLDAKNISMKNLLISEPEFDGLAFPTVYQLCICQNNGRLFLAPSKGSCQAIHSVCH